MTTRTSVPAPGRLLPDLDVATSEQWFAFHKQGGHAVADIFVVDDLAVAKRDRNGRMLRGSRIAGCSSRTCIRGTTSSVKNSAARSKRTSAGRRRQSASAKAAISASSAPTRPRSMQSRRVIPGGWRRRNSVPPAECSDSHPLGDLSRYASSSRRAKEPSAPALNFSTSPFLHLSQESEHNEAQRETSNRLFYL